MARFKFRYQYPALKTACIYAAFGGAWILLSDHVLGLLVRNIDLYARIQTWKGWLYILITAVLIFHLTARYLKRVERVARELDISRERLAMTLTGAGVGTWDWNVVSGEVDFSDDLVTMIGYVPDRFPPFFESWEALLHPDDKERVLKLLQAHLDGHSEGYECEYRLLNADGGWTWVLAKGRVCMRDDLGRPLRVVGIHFDQSERKKAEEELIIAREAALAANRAKSLFLANMSHEIRTPLNAMLGMLQLLEYSGLEEEQGEYAASAVASGRALLAALENVLNLTHADPRRDQMCHEHFVPAELAEWAMRIFRPTLEQCGAELHVSIARGTPSLLCGDADKLRQILFNLLSNALKFSRQDVDLKMLAVTDSRVERGAVFVLRIADRGKGMNPEQLADLFRFETTDGLPYSGDYLHKGLGLRVVRDLVVFLGGELCLSSEPDKGTEALLSIPVSLPLPEQVSSGTQTGTQVCRRVLLVEDEAVNRLAARRFLEILGHKVATASTGPQALKMASEQAFDCIFMDIRIPQMDGLEAVRAIRDLPGQRGKVPIIALTAHSMPNDRERFLSHGMDGYVAKPMTMEDLRRELEHVLGPAAEEASENVE